MNYKQHRHACIRCLINHVESPKPAVCETCHTQLVVGFVRGCKQLMREGVYFPEWFHDQKRVGWHMRPCG